MKLTDQQRKIVNHTGNARINAVAGSGKTSTIISFAEKHSSAGRILYLAFNRSVKMDARLRFDARGLNNVVVETAHSLAFKNIVPKYRYELNNSGYSSFDLVQLLKLNGGEEQHTEFIIANHIEKFTSLFCNSSARKVTELNYASYVKEPKAKVFVENHYRLIEKQTRLFLAKMDKGDIPITHDFYLKKFQLERPKLPYDFILFDEGQDASEAMLDIFLNQKSKKLIVGDTHQQIYGWRFAVNSLERTDFPGFQLTKSFRFDQSIADLAMSVLKWKEKLSDFTPQLIEGIGKSTEVKTRAVIARSNLGLLLHAIERVTDDQPIGSLYFEGNIQSYTYADDGTSLYDVLSLYNGYRDKIRDPLIKQMKELQELEEYIENTDDRQLNMMVEIVKEYGNQIPGIISKIKELHVTDDAKETAELIFSTVHRSKGMEYDSVQLVNDFITEDRLERLLSDKENDVDKARLSEEINLLYVAITRAKVHLVIPEDLLPEEFEPGKSITVLHDEEVADDEEYENVSDIMGSLVDFRDRKEQTYSYSYDKVREKHAAAYKKWSSGDDEELKYLLERGLTVKDISRHFGRTAGSIRSRIKKLELWD